ncbi:hypothetical protein PHPALM_31692 [Phytophthora palmivora]|uniref:Uncharacterized protein n=1 Tax=Phytophthora palmivora TaxID=4796 RepID=A0A2P4X1X6_9STRA|nr:hypothetical protein PHPALM_31692 [Phytophthora palmivora]
MADDSSRASSPEPGEAAPPRGRIIQLKSSSSASRGSMDLSGVVALRLAVGSHGHTVPVEDGATLSDSRQASKLGHHITENASSRALEAALCLAHPLEPHNARDLARDRTLRGRPSLHNARDRDHARGRSHPEDIGLLPIGNEDIVLQLDNTSLDEDVEALTDRDEKESRGREEDEVDDTPTIREVIASTRRK